MQRASASLDSNSRFQELTRGRDQAASPEDGLELLSGLADDPPLASVELEGGFEPASVVDVGLLDPLSEDEPLPFPELELLEDELLRESVL